MKVQILNIENIPWAKRLIITYSLSQDCFNPSAGGWEYIPDACGYRNVCDADWTVMTPNTQHPVHSNVIKNAGTYYYVWDYGGVYGLNPANFDSQHSYVVQLGLNDTTCSYVDPCAFSNYLTQFNEEPYGIVNTSGDELNTNNNCGVGYHLVADANGCLFCKKDEQPLPTEPEPNVPIVFAESNEVLLYTELIRPGFGWSINDPQPGMPPVLPVQPIPGPPLVPTDGGDEPVVPVLTPPPLIPNRPDDDTGGTVTVVGSADPSVFDANSNEFGPGKTVPGSPYATTYGGKSPQIDPERELSSKVSSKVRDLISKTDEELNKRRVADQLNLSTNSFKSSDKPDITINNVPITSEIRSSTRAVNAINIVNKDIYIRNRLNSKTEQSNGTSNLNTSFLKVDESGIGIRNVNDSKSQYSSNKSASNEAPVSQVSNEASTSRSLTQIINNVIKNINFKFDDEDFISNFEFKLIVDREARSGSGIFCECFVKPKHSQIYRYTLRIFLKTDISVQYLLSSKTVDRKGNILIAQRLPCNVSSGTVFVVAAVFDENSNIIASRVQPVKILDAGTRYGKITSSSSTIAEASNQSIYALINATDPFKLTLGEPSYYKEFIITAKPGAANAILGIIIDAEDPQIKHAIEIYKSGSLLYRSVGQLDMQGISPVGVYNSALYQIVNRSTNATLVVRVSALITQISKVNIYISNDYSIAEVAISNKIYSDGIFSFTIDTPFKNTALVLYDSGAENKIPNSPTYTNVTTDSNGSANVSMPVTRRSWIGIAFEDPSTASISNRSIVYIREDVSL